MCISISQTCVVLGSYLSICCVGSLIDNAVVGDKSMEVFIEHYLIMIIFLVLLACRHDCSLAPFSCLVEVTDHLSTITLILYIYIPYSFMSLATV